MLELVPRNPIIPRPIFGQTLAAITRYLIDLSSSVTNEFVDHAYRLNNTLARDGTEAMEAPLTLMTYTVATVPAASLYTGAMIYVSNETGGAVPAFSDGTNWRRVTDRNIIA